MHPCIQSDRLQSSSHAYPLLTEEEQALTYMQSQQHRLTVPLLLATVEATRHNPTSEISDCSLALASAARQQAGRPSSAIAPLDRCHRTPCLYDQHCDRHFALRPCAHSRPPRHAAPPTRVEARRLRLKRVGIGLRWLDCPRRGPDQRVTGRERAA